LETSKEEKTADLLANKSMNSEISLDDVLEEELV
jgi:hypothetical protein